VPPNVFALSTVVFSAVLFSAGLFDLPLHETLPASQLTNACVCDDTETSGDEMHCGPRRNDVMNESGATSGTTSGWAESPTST